MDGRIIFLQEDVFSEVNIVTGHLKVSVLIPTMNRCRSLDITLKHLAMGAVKPYEIIIVDQSIRESADKNRNIIQKYYKEPIHYKYIYLNRPSLTAARNIAIAEATGDILCFSDDDVEVYPLTLKCIVDLMEKDPQIALIGGLDDNAPQSKSKIGYLFGTKSWKNRKIGHMTLSILGRYPAHVTGEVSTQWAMGYFFCVRKKYLDTFKTDGEALRFDELLTGYAYAEDLDFTYRYYKQADRLGLKCILSDQVRVKHLVDQEYRIPNRKAVFKYICNRAYLAHKFGKGTNKELLYRIAMSWTNFWIYIFHIIRHDNAKDYHDAIKWLRSHRKEVYRGYIKYD